MENLENMDELPLDNQTTFYAKVLKAFTEFAEKNRRKPSRILIHHRLYEQLVPAEHRFIGRPILVFSVPLDFEVGVPYGEFVLEDKQAGVVKGY